PLAEGDRVVGAVLLGKLADRAVDQLVVAAVEVAVDQVVGDAVVGIGRQHQSAEHRLLGLDRLRRHAQLLDPAIAAWFIAEPGTCGHRAVELLRSEGRERRRFSERVSHRRRSACGLAMEQPVDKTISYMLVISRAAMSRGCALRPVAKSTASAMEARVRMRLGANVLRRRPAADASPLILPPSTFAPAFRLAR